MNGGRDRAHDHLPEIRAGLRVEIELLARQLLSEPLRAGRNGRTLKFGSRSGSLHVEIGGSKQGLWYDHAERVGGDALALIQHVNGGTFADAVAWAAGWLGIDLVTAARPTPALCASSLAMAAASGTISTYSTVSGTISIAGQVPASPS